MFKKILLAISIGILLGMSGCGGGGSDTSGGTGGGSGSNPCDSGYSLIYSLDTAHPAGSISSSDNKVFVKKSCQKEREVKTLKVEILGTFKNQQNKYDMHYSNTNIPFNGYSRYSYYDGTQYEGLRERNFYASKSYDELIDKIESNIGQCKRYADNYSGGQLNNDNNFWTYFCPKIGLVSTLNSLWSDEKGSGGSTKNLPSVLNLTYEIKNIDKINNTASVYITSEISNEISVNIYDNSNKVNLDSGDAESGTITLSSGRHNIKICATNIDGKKCSDELLVIISKNLGTNTYYRYILEDKSMSVSNDGVDIIYITQFGKMYSLNITTEESTYIKDIPRRDASYINGLAYINSSLYYFSEVEGSENDGAIYKSRNNIINKISSIPFPDGLDMVDNKLYSVTKDESGDITTLDKNGNKLSILKTGINDLVGISHSDKFLYVLAEDGSIYQVDKVSGKSLKIFTNDNLFSNTDNGIYGVEAITILNNRIYISYINDNSLYLIDINIKDYE